MRIYDPTKLLIFNHVPKTAGTSVRDVFTNWFQPHLYTHYFDRSPDEVMPEKWDIGNKQNLENPAVIYGHFNMNRQGGVEDYYPNVDQFITILRDPYEMTVSLYRFSKERGRLKEYVDFDDFMLNMTPNMLNQFPRKMTFENYQSLIQEKFVAVGVTEKLFESLERIGKALGMPFEPTDLPKLNVSSGDIYHNEDIKIWFRKKHKLEYAIYDYVSAMYD